MTNFDKIRSMGMKELALCLKQFSDIDFADYCENHPECRVTIGCQLARPCEKCIEHWLNMEV